MNFEINKSFDFLIAEYDRLRLKKNNKTITKEEIEVLNKLTLFIGSYKK